MILSLIELVKLNCFFIVGGRFDFDTNSYVKSDTIYDDIPIGFKDRFIFIKENEFREDISSTIIRKKLKTSNI